MKTEFVDDEYVLRLSRSEIVVIISGLAAVDSLMPSDPAFRDYVGQHREQVREFVGRLADFVRSVPFTPGIDSIDP